MIAHLQPSPRDPRRTVVLGSQGFLARALRQEFAQRNLHVEWIGSSELDLSAPDAGERLAQRLEATDTVLMLSALTPDRGRDIQTFRTNLAMMEQVCAALSRSGAAHLIYVSSDAVYGTAVTRVDAQTPVAPADLYGAMHTTRELMARALPVPLCVLRITGVYGPGDPHNSYGPNRFRRMAESDRRITMFGAGDDKRDHVFVGDVARLIAECIRHQTTGVINVATGQSTAFKRVAQLVAQQFTQPIEIVEASRSNPVTHRHYDVTPLIKAFPRFQFMSLEDGVALTHRMESAS